MINPLISAKHEAASLAAKVFFGCATIIIGTGIAIAMVPNDFYQPGALRLAGFAIALGILAPILFSLKNDALSLLRGENILLSSLVYWVLLDILQGGTGQAVSKDAVIGEFIMLGTAALGFWIGACVGKPIRPKMLLKEAFRPMTDIGIFRLVVMAFLLGAWDFVYRANFDLFAIVGALYGARWDSPWQREQLGDWSAFSFHLQYFGYLVPALTVLIFTRKGLLHPVTLSAGFMSLIIMLLQAQGGGRRIIGAMILSGLFCWIISTRKFDFRRLLLVVVVLACLTILLQYMLIYRNIGFGDAASAVSEYDHVFVDDNFLRVAQMIEFVPDVSPFVGFQYVIYALVRPVPRVFWPGKPVDAGFSLADLLGVPDTSFALTAAGELYVSYGFLAVFIGCWVYGRLATIVNSLLVDRNQLVNPLFPSLALVWLFVGVRSMLEIVLMAYVLVAATLLSRAIGSLDSVVDGIRNARRVI